MLRISTQYLMLFSIICLTPILLLAAEEILYERPISDDDKAHFNFSTFRKYDVIKYKSLEQLKEAYKHLPIGPEDVKIVLYYNEDNRPLYIEITIRGPKKVATIYEREIAKIDMERYHLYTTSWEETIPDGLSIDEIKTKYGNDYWDKWWGIQKVELYFKGAWKGQYDREPAFTVHRLRPCIIMPSAEDKEREETWKANALKTIAINSDLDMLKHSSTKLRCPDRQEAKIEFYPILPLGEVNESYMFKNNDETPLHTHIMQWPGEKVPEHEILRPVMLGYKNGSNPMRFSLKKSQLGLILFNENTLDFGELGKQKQQVAYWVSGNLQIYFDVVNVDMYDIIKLYTKFGKTYPSAIPADLKLDRTAWFKDEVQEHFIKMKRSIPLLIGDPEDTFVMCLSDILKIVRIPDVKSPGWVTIERERKEELFAKVESWWKANSNSLVWSDKENRLVINYFK